MDQMSPENERRVESTPETSPEIFSSNDEVSPVSDDPRERLPPPPLIPLPPPPARGNRGEEEERDQPGPSGWTAPATERVKRTKRQAKDMLDQATANRVQAAKPPGESIKSFQGESTGAEAGAHIISSLRSKGSDLSVLLDGLNSLTSEGEFDPLTVQLDQGTLEIISKGGYVDLRHLVPRESLGDEADEEELHWVIQEGTPKLKKRTGELLQINGFRRWMTAFSCYARIYTKSNPDRAPETHQYILDIQEATQTYTWDSIYAYDKIFRMYMETKPYHDWGTPYTKYWDKVLKKKEQNPGRGSFSRQKIKKRPCWRLHKTGTCDRRDCEFDNCCQLCGRFGHWKGTCYHNKDGNQRRSDPKEVKGHKTGTPKAR